MTTLSPAQVEAFRRDGTIAVEDAVTPQQLAALRREFDAWWEESRAHERNYGEMIDGRPRFDLQIPGHSRAHPLLRRVNSRSCWMPVASTCFSSRMRSASWMSSAAARRRP